MFLGLSVDGRMRMFFRADWEEFGREISYRAGGEVGVVEGADVCLPINQFGSARRSAEEIAGCVRTCETRGAWKAMVM